MFFQIVPVNYMSLRWAVLIAEPDPGVPLEEAAHVVRNLQLVSGGYYFSHLFQLHVHVDRGVGKLLECNRRQEYSPNSVVVEIFEMPRAFAADVFVDDLQAASGAESGEYLLAGDVKIQR